MDHLKAITQSILAQKQHPGPFLETREQELSYGTKINGICCCIVGDISFLSFDRSYISPIVLIPLAVKIYKGTKPIFYKWSIPHFLRKGTNNWDQSPGMCLKLANFII